MNFDVRSGKYIFKHATDEGTLPDNPHYLPHSHKTYELYYFISGEGDYNVGGQKYQLRPGSILLVPPNTVHNLILTSPKKYERIVLNFPKNDLPASILEGLKEAQPYYFVRNSEIEKEIKQLDVHFMNVDSDMLLLTFQMSLNVILSYLISYSQEDNTLLAEDIRVLKALEYIDDNLAEIESLEDICDGVGVSRSALSKLFTSQIGIPIMSYVRYKRCMYVDTLIEQGERPTEAYQKAGFRDYSTFYRVYMKTFQHAPSYGHNNS